MNIMTVLKKRSKKFSNISDKKKQIVLGVLIVVALVMIFASSYPASNLFGKVYNKMDSGVYLTFDDGVGPETGVILGILKDYNVKATFFIVCDRIDNLTIKKMVSEGHEVGVHTQSHDRFYINKAKEIGDCKKQLETATWNKINYFRPPYGFRTVSTMIAANIYDLKVITWSNFPRDYSAITSEQIVNRVLENLEDGDIIVLHDGPGEREKTVEALPKIIEGIKEKGFEIKLLTEAIEKEINN